MFGSNLNLERRTRTTKLEPEREVEPNSEHEPRRENLEA